MATKIEKTKLQKIIEEGDAAILVAEANTFGQSLANDKVSKSQIRNVFGEVRTIDMNWSQPSEPPDTDSERNAKENRRRLLLLKPRMAYMGKRDPKTKPLMDTMTDAVDLVAAEMQTNMLYRRFRHFAELFEAILAYHTAYEQKPR